MRANEMLVNLGLDSEVLPERSSRRFPDNAHFRVEIPSVEGPNVFEAVLQEASRRGVVVNRVSQGSGAMTLTEGELRSMAAIGAGEQVEVCLFVGPREEWGLTGSVRVGDGAGLGGHVRGLRQLRFALEDVLRACEVGIRSFLVADIGLLRALVTSQQRGELPSDVVWKTSVFMAPSNPSALVVLEELGASTVNVPTDVSLAELAELRTASAIPLDLYLESPDSLGGVVRGEQLGDLVLAGAPLYCKFGLRNSQGLYPSGQHLEPAAMEIGREKVRRAAIALEWAARMGADVVQSRPGAAGLAVPQL